MKVEITEFDEILVIPENESDRKLICLNNTAHFELLNDGTPVLRIDSQQLDEFSDDSDG